MKWWTGSQWLQMPFPAGKRMNVLVKGDDASKYPSLQGVIIALKKNDEMKFQVVTQSGSATRGYQNCISIRPTGNQGRSGIMDE